MVVSNNETGKSVDYDGPVNNKFYIHHTTILLQHCIQMYWFLIIFKVQGYPDEKKFPYACTFEKKHFSSFFEKDFVSLKKQSKPFSCRLIVYPPNNNSCGRNAFNKVSGT